MKLKNLLFATMFACAFASCSSDDDPVIDNGGGGTPVAKDEAVLVVNMTGVDTKANIAPNENAINAETTRVIVFNGTDDNAKVEAVGPVNQSLGEDNKITLSPGNKKVLVLANYNGEITQGTTTFSELENKTIDFEGFEGSYLTMNSAVFTVSLKAGEVNYLGYTEDFVNTGNKGHYLSDAAGKPVYLYHNVAKVVLNKIVVDESSTKTQYPNPDLDVKKVFILHAHKKSKLFTEAAWGETNLSTSYLNAKDNANENSESYTEWVTYMKEKEQVFNYLDADNSDAGYEVENYSDLKLGWKTGINSEGEITAGTKLETVWGDKNKKTFYIYENPTTTESQTELYTLLVVKGDFSYDGYEDGSAVRKTDYNRYYSVAVGITGFENGYIIPSNEYGLTSGLRGEEGNGKGVIRNLQYSVGMTVKGPGYTTPFGPKNDKDAFLAVNVQVVEFGEVIQDTEFE